MNILIDFLNNLPVAGGLLVGLFVIVVGTIVISVFFLALAYIVAEFLFNSAKSIISWLYWYFYRRGWLS